MSGKAPCSQESITNWKARLSVSWNLHISGRDNKKHINKPENIDNNNNGFEESKTS